MHGHNRTFDETLVPDSVCTDLNFSYEDELGINIASKADMFDGKL